MKPKFKNLIPYLPYNLEGILEYDRNDDFIGEYWYSEGLFDKGSKWKLCGYTDGDLNVPLGEGEYDGFLWRNGSTYVCFYEGIKPVLRPLSDLVKDDWKEEVVTHYEHLNIDIRVYNSGNNNENDFTLSITYKLMGEVFTDVLINRGSTKETPRHFLEWLYENHFDVNNLIKEDKAININIL